jgi:hypothetical protein
MMLEGVEGLPSMGSAEESTVDVPTLDGTEPAGSGRVRRPGKLSAVAGPRQAV